MSKYLDLTGLTYFLGRLDLRYLKLSDKPFEKVTATTTSGSGSGFGYRTVGNTVVPGEDSLSVGQYS